MRISGTCIWCNNVRSHERQSFHSCNTNNTIFVFAFQRRTEEGTTGLVNTYPRPRLPGVFAYISLPLSTCTNPFLSPPCHSNACFFFYSLIDVSFNPSILGKCIKCKKNRKHAKTLFYYRKPLLATRAMQRGDCLGSNRRTRVTKSTPSAARNFQTRSVNIRASRRGCTSCWRTVIPGSRFHTASADSDRRAKVAASMVGSRSCRVSQ